MWSKKVALQDAELCRQLNNSKFLFAKVSSLSVKPWQIMKKFRSFIYLKYTGFDNGTIKWNIDKGKDFIMVSMSDDIDGKIQANDNDEGSLNKI